MPPHPSFNLEKSPIDAFDYGGLQLDTRAKENQDVYLDDSKPQGFLDDDFDNSSNYLNEKQAHVGVKTREYLSPGSPDSTEGTYGPGVSPLTPGVPNPKRYDESLASPLPSPPPPPKRRICGLQSRHFWELFALALMAVVTAAIVGGVLGGLKTHKGSSSTPVVPQASNNTNTNTTQPWVALEESDVQVGSPLCVVTYDEGPGESLEARQAFRLYFQSAHGNIKESTSYHLEPWSSALPIFTDAVNNTGLATVTYLNQWLSQVGSIFYVGSNGLLQEKRKIYNDTSLWEPGTLNNWVIAAVGNITVPARSNDPANGWDSYRMAAVYSKNFHSGPGTRLFHHTQELNGTSYVQELIWYQNNDTWAYGARINTAWPNSHLAATIDESTKVLRLYFSSGNNTLQEIWMSLTDPNSEYTNGVTLDHLLDHNNADIAALSINGTTYIYHYAFSNQTSEAGIHELTITGTPGSVNNQEAYNLSSPFVVSPQLTLNKEEAFYQPIAVSNTAVPGLDPTVYVFFADKVSGDPATTATGYTELAEINRPFRNATWPSTGRLVIDLGDSNSDPEP